MNLCTLRVMGHCCWPIFLNTGMHNWANVATKLWRIWAMFVGLPKVYPLLSHSKFCCGTNFERIKMKVGGGIGHRSTNICVFLHLWYTLFYCIHCSPPFRSPFVSFHNLYSRIRYSGVVYDLFRSLQRAHVICTFVLHHMPHLFLFYIGF